YLPALTGECPERQRGRTVNPLAYAFVGSSPTSPTRLKLLQKTPFRPPLNAGISMSRVSQKKTSNFNGRQRATATPRDTRATWRNLWSDCGKSDWKCSHVPQRSPFCGLVVACGK